MNFLHDIISMGASLYVKNQQKKLKWKVTFWFDMRNSERISILWIHAGYGDEVHFDAVDPGHTRLLPRPVPG